MLCIKPYYRDYQTGQVYSTRTVKKYINNPVMQERLLAFGCGQCIPCRINLRRAKTCAGFLEAGAWAQNAFFTLTYSDECLPKNENLQKKDLQDFFKKLRKLMKKYNEDRVKNGEAVISNYAIRYTAVGEYGSGKGQRKWNPHYHGILFNYPFDWAVEIRPDVYQYGPRAQQGVDLITKAWTVNGTLKGRVMLGSADREAIQYCMGYVLKKMTKDSDPRLEGRDPEFHVSSKGRDGTNYGAIGESAINELARTMRRFWVDENDQYNGPPVTQIKHSNKTWPLTKHLQKKLNEALNCAECVEGVQKSDVLLGTYAQIMKHTPDNPDVDFRDIHIERAKNNFTRSERKQRMYEINSTKKEL